MNSQEFAKYHAISNNNGSIKQMNSQEFIDFINANAIASRGAIAYNIKTCNVSKKAQNILANSNYKALAKAHVSANIKKAYYNNDAFAQKLQEVLQELQITLIA